MGLYQSLQMSFDVYRSIQSDSDTLHFPARMAQSSMAETQRTTIFVLGENTAKVDSGWEMSNNTFINSEGDAVTAFEDALLVAASSEVPAYLRTYSGSHENLWLTRFDTLAPRVVHTVDPNFGFDGRAAETCSALCEHQGRCKHGASPFLRLTPLPTGWEKSIRRLLKTGSNK